jgi:hypothetical protein
MDVTDTMEVEIQSYAQDDQYVLCFSEWEQKKSINGRKSVWSDRSPVSEKAQSELAQYLKNFQRKRSSSSV